MLPQDPNMLLSVVNTKLRDQYADFASLCEDSDEDAEAIEQRLAAMNYHYDEEKNQFV